ncbi:SEC-C metal-binding domain-containing protein [Rhodopirellula baltica]
MSLPTVIDAEQLKRIESTHRGFFYQHLFAVGCLLIAQRSGVKRVVVERDEDLELELADSRVYVQVKTRSDQLDWHDIEFTVEGFADVRAEHERGNRNGTPLLYVVCNVGPGQSLLNRCAKSDWPSDVRVLWPSSEDVPSYFPELWPTLDTAFDWCRKRADEIPFGSVSGDVLAWKLAARVQFACTGEGDFDHSFRSDELPDLFNQVIVQLQSFPDTPKPYVPQSNEPPYLSETRVRVISGLSGSGKTAWASEASIHLSDNTVYFDVGDTPNPAIAASIVRESSAKLFPNSGEERSAILLPGYSGLDSLRALDGTLAKKQMALTIFADNAQQADTDQIVELVNATPHINWIVVSQPCPAQANLLRRLDITSETIRGWDADSIGSRFNSSGLTIQYETAELVRSLTDGLPLFVKSMIGLSKEMYDGNVALCCEEVGEAAHASTTVQDVIVGKIRQQLSDTACKLVGAIALSEVPLTLDELKAIADVGLGFKNRVVGRSVRELRDWGVIQHMRGHELNLHDAFRPMAAEVIDDLGDETVLAVRTTLSQLLVSSLIEEPDHFRQRVLLQLFPLIGQTETLVELATNESEYLRELGLIPQLSVVLRSYVDSPDSKPSDKFWALDTLALYANDEKELDTLEAITEEMQSLFDTENLGTKERAALATKRLLKFGRSGDVDSVLEEMKVIDEVLSEDPEHRRILVYDCAAGLFLAGKFVEASEIAGSVAQEYFEELEFTEGLASQNLPEIRDGIKQTDSTQSNLKRLADCLELFAMSNDRLKRPSFPARLHAHKFYILAGAFRSAIRVGQDCADELLQLAPNAWESRNFIEHSLLQAVQEYKLLEYVVPVRSQYAVAVAYCGDIALARKEMQALQQFEISDERQKEELRMQTQLVEEIAGGYNPFLERQAAMERLRSIKPQDTVGPQKVGRNSPCPCGSGKKYKKCCLRNS